MEVERRKKPLINKHLSMKRVVYSWQDSLRGLQTLQILENIISLGLLVGYYWQANFYLLPHLNPF